MSREIKPDIKSAVKQHSEWFNRSQLGKLNYNDAEARAVKFKDSIPSNLPDRFKTLTHEQIRRRKYHTRPDIRLMYLFTDIDKWMAFSLYINMLSDIIKSSIIHYLEYADYADRDRLKDLSMLYKKNQTLLSNDWIFFVETERLSDYVPAPNHDEILTQVKDWVSEPARHSLRDVDFLELYRMGCKKFFSTGYNAQTERKITVDKFLSDPMYWATPGSSDAEITKFMNRKDRRLYKTRKSKWSTAFTINKQRLYALFFDNKPQRLTAAPKREPAKARMIISGDMPNYLRMGYVAYWMESVLHSHPNTTLFYNAEQMLDMWTQMIDNTCAVKGKKKVQVTLDESEFDRQVNTDMLRIKCEEVRNFITTHAPFEIINSLLNAWDMTMKSIIDNGTVVIKVGGRISTVHIHNGILSGWRLTAFFDTLSNIAKIHAFRWVTVHRTGTLLSDLFDPIDDFTSQGDDIRSRSPTYLHAEIFTALYAEAGFKVHPGKFFVSPISDEFLRKVAQNGKELVGYPARGVAALLFRNPISKDPPAGADRIKEMANDWLQVMRRVRNTGPKVWSQMVRDIAKGNNISKKVVEDVLHTPSNLGGLGVYPIIHKRVEIIKHKTEYDIKVDKPPLVDGLTTHKELQDIIVNQWSKGIDWGKHAPATTTPFTIKITDEILPNMKITYDPSPIQIVRPSTLFIPRTRDDLTPSVAFAWKESAKRMNRTQLRESMSEWLDGESQATLVKLLSNSSLYVIREWINGDMLGNPPKSKLQGDTVVPVIYKKAVMNNLTAILTSAKVTGKALLKARLSAEAAVFDVTSNMELFFSD